MEIFYSLFVTDKRTTAPIWIVNVFDMGEFSYLGEPLLCPQCGVLNNLPPKVYFIIWYFDNTRVNAAFERCTLAVALSFAP